VNRKVSDAIYQAAENTTFSFTKYKCLSKNTSVGAIMEAEIRDHIPTKIIKA